jgi:hypothetical protein
MPPIRHDFLVVHGKAVASSRFRFGQSCDEQPGQGASARVFRDVLPRRRSALSQETSYVE